MPILLVDDSEDMLVLLDGYLRQCGYSSTLTAQSAIEAFDQLKHAQSLGNPECGVDLILMDINMYGMDGIEACRKIKNEMGYPEIPVIMVTGVDDADHLKRAFDAGAMDYVNKPVNKLELQVRVRSALVLKKAMDLQKRANAQLAEKNDQLQEALDNVKVLRGLLPICAGCKKIKDDAGYWSGIESYISQHSEADFSHGICPDCVKESYPEVYERIKHKLPASYQ